jgi:hypothetical protein
MNNQDITDEMDEFMTTLSHSFNMAVDTALEDTEFLINYCLAKGVTLRPENENEWNQFFLYVRDNIWWPVMRKHLCGLDAVCTL